MKELGNRKELGQIGRPMKVYEHLNWMNLYLIPS